MIFCHMLLSLQLNADKTELLWFGSAAHLSLLHPDNTTASIDQCVIRPTTVLCDLGVWLDAELSM